MIYHIQHWFGGKLPANVFVHKFVTKKNLGTKKKPNWVDEIIEANAIEIDDIHEFVKTHRDIILRPPNGYFPYWVVVITDNGKFNQK